MSVVNDDDVAEIPKRTSYPKKTFRTQVSQILALYRLVDVLHALSGASEGRNPSYSRRPSIGISSSERASTPSHRTLLDALTIFSGLAHA